jgi:hypothetical protein
VAGSRWVVFRIGLASTEWGMPGARIPIRKIDVRNRSDAGGLSEREIAASCRSAHGGSRGRTDRDAHSNVTSATMATGLTVGCMASLVDPAGPQGGDCRVIPHIAAVASVLSELFGIAPGSGNSQANGTPGQRVTRSVCPNPFV